MEEYLMDNIVIIDGISIEEEIILIREEIQEEMEQIDRAWKAYIPRATWPQPLPRCKWDPEEYWHLNQYQIAFLKHLVFTAEIGEAEACGLANNLKFKTAWELHKEKWGDYPIEKIVEAMNQTDHLFYPKD